MNLLEDSTRRKFPSLAAILLLASLMAAAFAVRPSFAATSANAGVVVPLYNYPDSTWTTIAQAKTTYPSVPIIAVVNPSSGPGSSEDPNYLQGIRNLQAAGVTVLGYVATGYATSSYSPLSNLEPQIVDYKNWYGVNGIFFDEMSNTAGYESYYSTLNSYVKSNGMTYTMGNPGASVPSSYIGVLNNLVIYEDAGYPTLSYISYPGYPNSDFSMIAYGVSYSSTFVTSAALDVGYMYIDDLSGGNPYSTLSSLFAQTVATLNAVDTAGQSTTTTSSTSASTTTSTTSTTSSTTTASASAPVTITVKSESLTGTLFTGMWTTVQSGNGKTLATGYTTLVFNGVPGTKYNVCVSSYGSEVFSHWGGGSTNPCTTVTLKSSMTLTAYYGNPTSLLTVTSQTTTGVSISGYWTQLSDQAGTVLATGFTPATYTLNSGQSYTIQADGYGSCTFAYWQDNGNTNYLRTVSINSNTNLVAVYSC